MISRIRRAMIRIGVWLDELLFPDDVLCLACDHALSTEDEDGVCKSCRLALERLAARQEEREAKGTGGCPEGVDYIHAAYVYEGPVRKIIHRLKYESVRRAATPLARQMVYLPSGEEEIIVPVPTDKARERRRGFNQSALLAEHIGRELGMRVEPALWRVQTRRPQTGLPASERRKNLIGCMEAGEAVRGRRVLLIDDVYTTGATITEAARALRKAGAGSVSVFTAARAASDTDEAQDPFALPAGAGKRQKRRN